MQEKPELYLVKKLREKELWRIPLRGLNMDRMMAVIWDSLPPVKEAKE